jgi:predicted site-specific integrase-resolvase
MIERLTTAEAAKAVGIARHTLQRWISEGRVNAPKPISAMEEAFALVWYTRKASG